MNALIVVVKNPIPGAVKTRLQTRYTPEQAANLYTAFVRDTLDTVRSIDLDKRIIAYEPPNAEDAVRTICGDHWEYIPQVQEDLGQRMYQAILQQLQLGAKSAILIGTDIPSLPASYISQAFDQLQHKDVVLGPSTDGGYYLIGLSRPCPEIFQNINWSTSTVLSQTTESLRQHNYSLGLVPPWFDIDTPEELDFLVAHASAQELATGHPTLPCTLAYLSALT
jgi:rSAM/selenodomain-associated transferase 1